jgi:hypothetical protein
VPAWSSLQRPAASASASAVAAVAVLSGVAIGVAGRASDHVSSSLLYWAGTLGGPWLVAAFTLGAFAGSRRRGATAGAVALAVGVITYYAVFRLVEERTSTVNAVVVGTAWTLGALPIGAAFGWAGGAWRRTRGPRWAAVVAGALVGEALLLWLEGRHGGGPWGREDAVTALQTQALIGVGAALVLARARLRALAWTGGVALVVVLAEAAVRETLRATGWAGA